MNGKRERGVTLLEMMITIAVTTAFFVMVYSTLAGATNLVNIEANILDMDRQANALLQGVADSLRPAILPITRVSPSTPFQINVINTANGFAANGASWRNALSPPEGAARPLTAGLDFIAFASQVDLDGTGDGVDSTLDANGDGMYPYLGYQGPGASVVYNDGAYAGTSPFLSLNGRIANALANLAVGDVRSQENNANFGVAGPFSVIRFVPLMAGNGPMVVNEESAGRSSRGDRMSVDLNGDGDMADIYNIGSLRLETPDGQRFFPGGGGDMILRQINPDGSERPIFQLIRRVPGDIARGFANAGPGEYALLIRLLMCDAQGRDDETGQAFIARPGGRARYFETVVELRNMGL